MLCFSRSREPDIVRCWVWAIQMRSGRCTWAKLDTSRFGITFGKRSKTIEAYESITSYYPQPLANRLEGCEIDKGPRAQEKPSDHTPIIATLSDLP
jgi:hypothetical protein